MGLSNNAIEAFDIPGAGPVLPCTPRVVANGIVSDTSQWAHVGTGPVQERHFGTQAYMAELLKTNPELWLGISEIEEQTFNYQK